MTLREPVTMMSGRETGLVLKGLILFADRLVERVAITETVGETGEAIEQLADVTALALKLFRTVHGDLTSEATVAPPKRKHRRKVTLDTVPVPVGEPVN